MDIFHIILIVGIAAAWVLGGRQERRHGTFSNLREDYLEKKAKAIAQLDTLPEKRAELARAIEEIEERARKEAERLRARVGL